MEWISVNDRLPDYNIPVLVFLVGSTKGRKFPAVLKRVEEDDHDWVTADDDSELSPAFDVVCWQPIETPSNLPG